MIEIKNQEAFQELLQTHSLVLVDVWAEWCSSCKALMPTLNKLSDELGDTCLIAKVNAEELPELSEQFKIRSLPTVLIFKNGELKESLFGKLPENKYKTAIQNLI